MNRCICPICSGDISDKIGEIKLWIPKEYHLPEGYNIVSCKTCGFCYSDTEATLKDYEYYYANCNMYQGMPAPNDDWEWLNRKAENLISAYVSSESRMLDMGFGKGAFLKWMNARGYNNMVGIDPSGASVSAIRECGISAEVGSIFGETIEKYSNSMDCVFLFDVLEHMLYPRTAIDSLKKYVKSDGLLLISVPNYAYLKENDNPIVNMFNQEHINYFSIDSLNNLMYQSGFEFLESNDTDRSEEIVALYKMTGESKEKIFFDSKTTNAIEDYIRRFEPRKNSINDKLTMLKDRECTHIYVWGTGAFTMWLLANTIMKNFDIQLIDNNRLKIDTFLNGNQVRSPEYIVDKESPIVICSMLYGDRIKAQIRDMGLQNEVIIL